VSQPVLVEVTLRINGSEHVLTIDTRTPLGELHPLRL
jgi:hypothetical protein